MLLLLYSLSIFSFLILKPRFAFSIAFVAGQAFQFFGQPLPALAHKVIGDVGAERAQSQIFGSALVLGDAGAFVALLPINLFFPDLLKPRFAFSIAFVAGQAFQIFGQPPPALAHPADEFNGGRWQVCKVIHVPPGGRWCFSWGTLVLLVLYSVLGDV